MRRLEWLKSVWAIVAAMVLGVLIGLYRPAWAQSLALIGNAYVTFLVMCVPPIMLTAVSSSVSRLVRSASAGRQIRRMALVFAAFMLTTSFVTVMTMLVVAPGSTLPPQTQAALGHLIRRAEAAAAGGSWADLFLNVVPHNVLAALVENNYPQILFVSILLGLLLGFTRAAAAQELVAMAEAGFKMFQMAISWSTYVLPFAIVGIMAGQVARTGFEIVLALIKLLAVGLALAVGAIVVALLLIARVQRRPVGSVWTALRRPIMMGFGTTNSMAVMPLLMDSLEKAFALPQQLVSLVVPLSVLIARNANVLYAGMMLMFAAQLYDVDLSPGRVAVMIVATVIGTVAGSGMPTIPFLTTLTVVSYPMGFPIEAVIPVFVSILPVLDPFGTAAGVTLHAAAASTIIGKPPAAQTAPAQETAPAGATLSGA